MCGRHSAATTTNNLYNSRAHTMMQGRESAKMTSPTHAENRPHSCGPEAAVEVSDAYARLPRVRLPCQFLLAGPQTAWPPPPQLSCDRFMRFVLFNDFRDEHRAQLRTGEQPQHHGEDYLRHSHDPGDLLTAANRRHAVARLHSPSRRHAVASLSTAARSSGHRSPAASHSHTGSRRLGIAVTCALEVAPRTSRASPLSPTSAERAVVEIFADVSRETVLGYDSRSIHHNVGEILRGGQSYYETFKLMN
ncbi:hypothetical protein GQ600_3202 [Phytophthora cactorum]|nr:hypothetical protein GQ600_3202 [Phytophthora cactorum]